MQCAWNSRIWNFEFRKTLLPLRNLWNFAPCKRFRPVFCGPSGDWKWSHQKVYWSRKLRFGGGFVCMKVDLMYKKLKFMMNHTKVGTCSYAVVYEYWIYKLTLYIFPGFRTRDFRVWNLLPTVAPLRMFPTWHVKRLTDNLIWFAFITGNSSLEPLIEGLCAQIHVNLR